MSRQKKPQSPQQLAGQGKGGQGALCSSKQVQSNLTVTRISAGQRIVTNLIEEMIEAMKVAFQANRDTTYVTPPRATVSNEKDPNQGRSGDKGAS